MFTIDQIKEAHSKVRSGSDFPIYIQDIIKLGVIKYETQVKDGKTTYWGKDGFEIHSGAKYSDLEVATHSDVEQFRNDLKATQQGKTDYPTFCIDCAKSGVSKWIVDTVHMTCTYYDKNGNEVLEEVIPAPNRSIVS